MALKKERKDIYMNNPNLPTVDATFEYTPEMVSEIKKCKENILYFAENYFYILSLDHGKIKIPLYKCQKKVLKKLKDNRRVILLASRQIGKALDENTPIPTPNGWTTMGALKDGAQIYAADGTICTVIKAHDTMYNRDCYKVIFDNGEEITADGDHLWYTETNNVGSVKSTHDILLSDTIHTIPNKIKGGYFTITSVRKVESVPVRCITVDSKDNLYLCGKQYIPTHNTTMFTIYCLWLACFFEDQKILIVANKEATASEIFQRVRMAYEQLPNWLKPGSKEYAKTSMWLANDSRIGISTTTGTAARGSSCNCVVGDSIVTIKDTKTSMIFDISMKNLTDILANNEQLELTIIDE